MRKRSSYRPKPVLVNPLLYVLESMKPVKYHDSYLMDLKIKNHGAMTELTQGRADEGQINFLIVMSNTAEALSRMGFGTEYKEMIRDGSDALLSVGRRGLKTGKFILKSEEMNALNNLMSIHDEQIELITVKDMERAVEIVNRDLVGKKMRTILEKTA